MTRQAFDEQHPRLESLAQAHLREQTEALERRCPVHRCRAGVGELCTNPETGRPYAAGISHRQRVTG